jgi:rod shape-determining protein MreD
MSTVLLLALAFVAVLFDVAAAPGATMLDVRPQLTLVIVALWSVLRPSGEVFILAPAAGLMLGLVGHETLGVSVLALAPIVMLGLTWKGRSTGRRAFSSIGLVVVGTLVYAVVHSILSRVMGRPLSLGPATVGTVVMLAIVNAGLAAVLYWPLARLPSDPGLRDEIRRY